MLSLANLHKQIEQLEEAEYSAIDERLSVWFAMVQWQFFVAQYDDAETAKKVLYSLPNDHEMRITAGKLTWFMCYFVSALPDTTWKSEKAEIAFACWLEEAIAENFSESALATETAMNDAIQFVAECLQNGSMDFFDELKKQEQETWQKKLEFRRLANFGELTPEMAEWLETNDTAFWTNFNAKKQTEVKPAEVKPARVEAIPEALPEVKPEVPKPTNEYVSAFWSGLDEGWLVDSLDGTLPVHRGREYHLSSEVWQHIESDSYLRQRWHKVSHE